MKHAFSVFIASIFVLASCSYPEGYKTIQEKNIYEIDVAGYLTKTRDMWSVPSLQYHNRFRTVYLIVVDKLKSTTNNKSFEEFNQDVLKDFKTQFPGMTIIPSTDSLINGHRAIVHEMEAEMDGEKVWYLLAVLEGKERYYQVCSW